jgi:NADH-quinone oxidoreductase subunit G
MAEIFIDNIRYEYEGNVKVLQFALDQGVEIPFFCYHPSMSIPANCRQCLVQVGTPVFNRETNSYDLDDKGERIVRYFPKLMTACSLDATDGMVVHTHVTSELVRRAQKDTLEFILVNHPLDCPICDQAGECPLQIQTYKYGPEGSRFEFKKVHKPKRIQLGPRVVLDAERCINCTRCVRFTEEISKTNQLTIVSRGDKNYPSTAPGREFDDAYSLNTVDICPVGALTAADFRFRARVWEMNQTPSIDITGGKGTNVDLWVRNNLVLRITPRFNRAVNDHWMPDAARLAYKAFNENRVSRPHMMVDGKSVLTSWTNAIETLYEQIQAAGVPNVVVIGSGHASVEDNFALDKLFTSLGHSGAVFTSDVVSGAGDDFLLTDDQSPNSSGCSMLGLDELSASELSKAVDSAKVVIILQDDLVGRGVLKADQLSGKYSVSLATNFNQTTAASDLIIPITCIAEHAASYVSIEGRIQRSLPAKETIYTSRTTNSEMSVGRLDRFGTKFDNWVSDQNKVDCKPGWEIVADLANRFGFSMDFASSRILFDHIADHVPALGGISYDKMDAEQGVIIDTSAVKTTA